ncbi:hypothetical protein [Mechercharimyces sp. CAU 1602]|uniref:hypothetical protein n=1 Tax=Mechercharimyces sp. CAU 1602 TaxID=2973933 RepID=UPI0021634AB9|nr:hypothetical protein [Mechercharimyces sp. CAU 1602]MCS1350509.1 hypothetical protein [Mechercharimyces sp. CAU 1602]
MKVTSIDMRIEEDDFDLYEQELTRCGWEKVKNQPIFRKIYGDTEVEVKETIPRFSGDVYFTVSARNKRGIDPRELHRILDELNQADITIDQED